MTMKIMQRKFHDTELYLNEKEDIMKRCDIANVIGKGHHTYFQNASEKWILQYSVVDDRIL